MLCSAMPPPTYHVLHRDDHLLVVSKAPGVLTVGHPGSKQRCVLDDLRRDGHKVAPVHRLDRETSGVLLLNLDRAIRADLEALFRKHEIEKTYLALVRGQLQPRKGVINVPILDVGKTARVDRRGKRAITRYQVVESFPQGASLVRLRIDTGRHNQIRVHMAHIDHPLLGDEKFGRRSRDTCEALPPIKRTMLHAERLVFEHPVTGKRLDVRCDPPDDFLALLDAFRDGAGPRGGGSPGKGSARTGPGCDPGSPGAPGTGGRPQARFTARPARRRKKPQSRDRKTR